MGRTVSVYLNDDALGKLDILVSQRAELGRARGDAEGNAPTRSSVMADIVRGYLDRTSGALSPEAIALIVTPIAKERGAKRISLFGAYAQGNATPASAIDLLLDRGRIKELDVRGFGESLARALGKPVDVTTTDSTSKSFLRRVADQEIVLYEAR